MRQLATLPSAEAARTFADHLQTLRIETRLERLADGWAVWVCDEDRLGQARKELDAFTENPADPRFTAARKAAEAMRRREERAARAEADDAEKRPPQPPARPGRVGVWTCGLILTSVLVFALHTGWLLYANPGIGMSGVFAIAFSWSHAEGQVVVTSPAQQALSIASFHAEPEGDKLKVTWFWLEDIRHGQVWRLITPIFLHFGLVHLLFNMTMLWQLGVAIEYRRGAWRYLLLVLATAVCANLAQYYAGSLSLENGWLKVEASPAFGGMSGVLYGLFGYIWMKSRYEPSLGLSISPRVVVWLLGWLVLCMTGAVGPIGNTAHVAGLLVGLVIGVAPHWWRLARARRPS